MVEMSSIVTLVYGTDRHLVVPMAVSLYSACEHFNFSAGSLRIYIISQDITAAEKLRLQNTIAKFTPRAELQFLSPNHDQIQGIPWNNYGPAALYRVILPTLLLNESRALWIDCDTIVQGNLLDLWTTTNDDALVWATLDSGFPTFGDVFTKEQLQGHNISPSARYFQSGVLAINLKRWRTEGTELAVLAFGRNCPELCNWPDQNMLNLALIGRWKCLDQHWNRKPQAIKPFKPEGIIHFIGSIKPWLLPYRYPESRLFWDYLRKTPFRGWKPPFSIRGTLLWHLLREFKSAVRRLLRLNPE